MTGDMGMDLPGFARAISARRRLIAAIVVVAAVLAFGWSMAQPSRYQGSADLLFGRTTNADSIITGGAPDAGTVPEREAATNLALASLDTVAANVKRRFRTDATPEDLKKAVTVTAQGASDVVTITAEWGSPARAAELANGFADEVVAVRRDAARTDIQRAIDALNARLPVRPRTASVRALADELQAKIADLEALKETSTGNVHLVERATPIPTATSPKPVRNAIIAAVVALLLAVFLVILLARLDDRVSGEDEIATLLGASVLARIPDVGRSRRPANVWTENQDPSFLEAFEFLRLNLQLIDTDRSSHVIAITSPAPGEGKSTVVGWLARSLALSGDEVVGVDLDLRKPELHAYLNAPREAGAGVLDALLASDEKPEPGARALLDDDGHESDRQEEKGGDLAGVRRRAYTDDDITAGLAEVARSGGNARRAARTLKAAGRDISESTLRRWRDVQHADLYAAIRAARVRGSVVAPNLRLLSGGKHDVSAGLLARGRLQRLFAQLGEEADYVLVDTFPVSTVADASAIAAAAGGVILVVDLPRARRRELLTAKRQLANARANVIGIVVNRADVDFPVYHMPEADRELTSGSARG
jgi:Mrp family chromosome partitioning ATPase